MFLWLWFFLGEIKKGKVSGFHNWIRFYLLEKQGVVDYFSHSYDGPVCFTGENEYFSIIGEKLTHLGKRRNSNSAVNSLALFPGGHSTFPDEIL